MPRQYTEEQLARRNALQRQRREDARRQVQPPQPAQPLFERTPAPFDLDVIKSMFLTKQYTYHAMIGSESRWQQLLSDPSVEIALWIDCKGITDHKHALVFTENPSHHIQRDAKRKINKANKPDTRNNYFKRIGCILYLANLVHYIHCSKGQTGHKHLPTTGVHPSLIHNKNINQCGTVTYHLRTLFDPTNVHDQTECECQKSLHKFVNRNQR